MVAYRGQVLPLSNAVKELGFNYGESGRDNKKREKALTEWALQLKNKMEQLTKENESLRYIGNERFDELE